MYTYRQGPSPHKLSEPQRQWLHRDTTKRMVYRITNRIRSAVKQFTESYTSRDIHWNTRSKSPHMQTSIVDDNQEQQPFKMISNKCSNPCQEFCELMLQWDDSLELKSVGVVINIFKQKSAHADKHNGSPSWTANTYDNPFRAQYSR